MSQPTFCFEEFELDVGGCELRRCGRVLRLERLPMELLMLLVENPGRLVRREAINERLWGADVFVETEHSINTAINKLRATLRDDSRDPRFIRTVVGRGYCFIAKVSVMHPVEVTSGSEHPSASVYTPAPDIGTSVNGNRHHPAPLSEVPKPSPVETTRERKGFPSQAEPFRRPGDGIGIAPAPKDWRVAGPVLLAFVLLAIVAVIYLPGKRNLPQRRVSEPSGGHSIAVLPFRNLAEGADQEYLVDGMTDQLISDLGRSTSLRVISYGSMIPYKGVQRPFRDVARELNVDMIVEGSYLHAAQKVRVTAELLDARNDRQVWARTYEESDADLLATQDQVMHDIAHQIALSLGSSFTGGRPHTVNPQARDAYLRGRYLWNQRTLHGLTESINYYTEALRADPAYADAYAALAESYVVRSIYGDVHPADSLRKAQLAAERALLLDNSLGQAHTALAAVKSDRDWDWSGAEKEYRRALQLDPDDPTAHQWYSLHLSRLGRFQEAEIEIQRALALDPLSLIINTDSALTARWARKPDEAMRRVESVLSLNPDFTPAHLAKGVVLEQLRKYREAEAEYKEAGRISGHPENLLALRAHALALSGARDPALKIVKELEAATQQRYVSGVNMAQVYCALGQTDDAMKWLDRAYQQHDTGINMLKVEPLYDGCRADPRFKHLVDELNLNS